MNIVLQKQASRKHKMGEPTCQMLTKTKTMNMQLAGTAHLPHESEVLQQLFGTKVGNEEVDKHWTLRERRIESTPYAESGFRSLLIITSMPSICS